MEGDAQNVFIKRKGSLTPTSHLSLSSHSHTLGLLNQSSDVPFSPSPFLSPAHNKSYAFDLKNDLAFSFDQVFWPSSNNLNRFSFSSSEFNQLDALTEDFGQELEKSQFDLYQYIGPRLLDSSLEGFNSCLLAYGQTGSGKSFRYILFKLTDAYHSSFYCSLSMMGDEKYQGVIPRIVTELFDRLKSHNSTTKDGTSIINEDFADGMSFIL